MLEHFFIQKITQQKCCHPQCIPLPVPYTAPCESSTVGTNAAGHLLIAYSRAPSLLPSLHLRTRTWFLLMQAWSLKIKKKSHGARSGEYGGCSNMVILCFIKNVLTDRALCVSVLSWWRTHKPFFHISGLLLLTHSRWFVKTSLYVGLPKTSENLNIPRKPLALWTWAARCLFLHL